MVLRSWVWIFLFVLGIDKGGSTVFLQSTATVSLPSDFPVGATFFRLQPVDEATGLSVDEGLIYHVLRSAAFPAEAKSGRGLFTVDEHTGSLMLSPHRKHSLEEYRGSTFALDVVAVGPSDSTTRATVVVTVAGPGCGAPRQQLCFAAPELRLQLPETLDPGTPLVALRPIPYQKLCPGLELRYLLESDDYLTLSDASNGGLRTSDVFDFEKQSYIEHNVGCELREGNASEIFYGVLQVSVLDVDDNAPYPQDASKLRQEIDISQVVPGKPLPVQLTVLDADSASVNNVTVSLDDPLALFHLRDPVVFHGVNGSYMLVNAAVVPKSPFYFPKQNYSIAVTFTDNNLVSSQQNRSVVFHILMSNNSVGGVRPTPPQADFQVVANVFRHSSKHARIVQPMEVQPHEGYFFRLLGEPRVGLAGFRIFGVTPGSGIVYVRDEAALARSSERVFQLQLTWRSREETDRRCTVKIRVLDAGDPMTVCGVEPGHHFPSCALHATVESCTASCGRGTVDGFCRWRTHVPPGALTSHYATCSPHLATCPDGTCDELEEMDPSLCPQDCAANIRGEAVQGTTGRGVGMSAAPCTCTSPSTCVCVRFYPRSRVRRPALRDGPQETETPLTIPTPAATYELRDDWTQCGIGCASMIVCVSLVILSLVAAATRVVVKHRSAVDKGQELASVKAPLNPNEGAGRNNKNTDLLEFPRSQLTLEDTLGEGEFGRVVKGQAWDIAGRPGMTTVAIKMLKDGSTSSERSDLVSELNLLKDISHPNVVRLLGACTDDDGPLYVIMEYAEHGSLIAYLRKMRANDPHVQGEVRELISFAWQVAKGMEYLAEMKVVHRDLAARNVLVATGKLMKISDFGLSRDVYEKDAYLKKTKGRVPYKWMAIESLQNQVYTTKSDVWSFGVLLWEIITLGGCPYPGTPSEKLFRLLKEGYRMPRPDDCPIQIYQLMTICWREKPSDRPHFKDLVRKLEFLLNDSMHYLPMRDTPPQKTKKAQKPAESSVMTQVTFPKMATVAIGPYENRRLLSPTEYSV